MHGKSLGARGRISTARCMMQFGMRFGSLLRYWKWGYSFLIIRARQASRQKIVYFLFGFLHGEGCGYLSLSTQQKIPPLLFLEA
jgi:hypothetical protein